MSDTSAMDHDERQLLQRRLARFLVGEGLELGPGHSPFPLPFSGTTVRYVDRWEPADNAALFPELDAPTFPQPDLIANLDHDRLRAVPDASVDFVIASHVLEHMAEPLGLIAEMHRVLRPGGTCLILLPDRRRTFDAGRPATTVAHLSEEHSRGVVDVDDEHVRSFLTHTGEVLDHLSPQEQSALFELHRRRSIHVHCWAEQEFVPVIEHCIRELGHDWQLLDVINNADVAGSIEFGLVLKRSTQPVDRELAVRRLGEVYEELGPTSVRATHAHLEEQIAALTLERNELGSLAHHQRLQLEALARSPLGPVLRTAWKLRQRRA